MRTAIIIDDEPGIRELLEITLRRMNISCMCAENLEQARELLQRKAFDICLTDMKLPDGSGVEFVPYLQRLYPRMPVAVITAHGNMETAIQALKYGAFDFLTKPVDLSLLRPLIESALKATEDQERPPIGLIGDSRIIQEIRAKIGKVARSQAPVYISGESGVGKELVARMIHNQGPRATQPFVPVNCGAIPQDLMESELFGHRKGSFTGAAADKQGLFQAAEGGTLFLDEVAELPLNMQVKLLRAIQEKHIRPVGSQREIPINVRILSATHKNLSALVKEGAFREDLFYRINVIELHVPSLRERKEDIGSLIEHILARLSERAGTSDVKLEPAARQALQNYDFPGNVRELENILERALTLCESSIIRKDDLQLPAAAGTVSPEVEEEEEEGERDLESLLGDVERRAILDALERTRWNRTAAARLLGISFRALRYRLKKLELE